MIRQPLILEIFKATFWPKGVKIPFYVFISLSIWNLYFFSVKLLFYPREKSSTFYPLLLVTIG